MRRQASAHLAGADTPDPAPAGGIDLSVWWLPTPFFPL